jgi:predicted MFS family arabinose efflux permease
LDKGNDQSNSQKPQNNPGSTLPPQEIALDAARHPLGAAPLPSRRIRLNLPASLNIFKSYNFRLFFAGQLVSLTGTWMQSTALQWLVYRLTNSQTSLGLVTFLNFLPVLLFSLPMGVLVDRIPKRKILLFTQVWFMCLAGILATITFLDVVQYWHVLVLAFFVGIGNSLDMPARQSFYVDIVGRENLSTAIGLNSAVFNAARIIGPAIGGIVVGTIGEAPAFATNAITFLAVIAGLLLMKLTPRQDSSPRQKGMKDLGEGLRYIYNEKHIFGLVTMVALFSFFGANYLVLLPVFARDILQIGAQGYGQLMSAQGIGAFIGAIGIIYFGSRRSKGRMLMATRLILGFALAGLALSRTPWLSFIALMFAGFSFVSQNVLTNTLIQIITPDELRGRVMSSFTWALGGFFPLGSLLMGTLGDRIGAPNVALFAAGSCFVLAIFNLIAFPQMKNLK